jgi:acyl carrier protein
MTESAIREAIFAGLRGVAPDAQPEALRPDQNIRETLELDSFDFLTFLIALHESLGVDIPEADYGKLTSVNALSEYLSQRRKEPN